MDVRFEQTGSALVVITQAERLDALFAKNFRETVVRQTTGQSLVVIDLQHVKYIDSTGLGCLVSIVKSIASGGHLRLANANAAVTSMIKLTRLDKVFPVYGDVAKAIEA